MLKKTITFVDYDDNTRTEDFYFNLNQAELTEMELSEAGGLAKRLDRIINTAENHKIVPIFKDLILRAYGQKSLDGRRFVKSQELSDDFSQTEAFNVLFMELCNDADAAGAFVNGVMPQNLVAPATKDPAPPKAL